MKDNQNDYARVELTSDYINSLFAEINADFPLIDNTDDNQMSCSKAVELSNAYKERLEELDELIVEDLGSGAEIVGNFDQNTLDHFMLMKSFYCLITENADNKQEQRKK